MIRSQRRLEPAPLVQSEKSQTQVRPKRGAKSRGGCQRCKFRHIKCDETKPHCHRCTEKGIACPGYVKQLKWSTRYESQKHAPVSSNDKSDVVQNPHPENSSGDDSTQSQGKPAECVSDTLWQVNTPPSSVDSRESFGSSLIPCWENTPCLGLGATELFPVSDISWSDEDIGTGLTQVASEGPTIVEVDSAADETRPCFTLDIASTNHANNQADDEAPQSAVDRSVIQITDLESTTESQSIHVNERADQYDAGQLLSWFYRMSPRQYSDMDLVDYYFHNVCRLYALFDSTQNPFRALVGSNWGNSNSIRLAIESMACGHLANREPFMVHLGRQKRCQARASIGLDVELWRSNKSSANQILLAMLLLGLSVSWHDPSDIGGDLIDAAREIVQANLQMPQTSDSKHNRQLQHFFYNAMIYWEMLVAFVSQPDHHMPVKAQALSQSPTPSSLSSCSALPGQLSTITVHPWTGVTPYVMLLFAEAGRLVRWCLSGQSVITDREIRWASEIEVALKSAQIPTCESVLDHGDVNTPKEHLIMLAEAYRWAGLLHIYHATPQLLSDRLTAIDGPLDDSAAKSEALKWYRGNLALRVLEILEKLPLSSGTTCLQPILLLTAGSELQFHAPTSSISFIAQPLHSRVASARAFAEQRLCELADRLPEKPYLRMLDIMKETWFQTDMLGVDIHWTQVMSVKGWETIMG